MWTQFNFILFVFVFFCATNAVFAAQLVGNEITLCTNGYSPDNSTCTAYTDGDCGSGYYDLTPSNTTFLAPSDNLCPYSGYKLRTLPDTTITLAYHGAVIGNEITLCTNGYSPDNSTCTTYTDGDCGSGYYDLTSSNTTFLAPSDNLCPYSGYKLRTLPETTITLAYHGAVIGSEITLCTNGYSANNTSCTAYSTDDCPTGYYNATVSGTSGFAVKDGSCATGFHEYIAEDSCGFEPSGSTCISFCGNGELTTGAGGCSILCGEGVTTLRTGTGLKYPLWATKQTIPSLNVQFENGNRCYMNLTSDPASSQTIWFQWGNNKLHATK